MSLIDKPSKAVRIARALITNWNKEHFIGIYLNARLFTQKVDIISIGTLNASLVHPRETFHPAVTTAAASIIVLHNHPSGGTEPSESDLELTTRLKLAGEILGIELHDHIIFTQKKWLSMRDQGLLK